MMLWYDMICLLTQSSHDVIHTARVDSLASLFVLAVGAAGWGRGRCVACRLFSPLEQDCMSCIRSACVRVFVLFKIPVDVDSTR